MISVPFKLYTNTSAAGFLITSAVYDPEEQTAAVLFFFLSPLTLYRKVQMLSINTYIT